MLLLPSSRLFLFWCFTCTTHSLIRTHAQSTKRFFFLKTKPNQKKNSKKTNKKICFESLFFFSSFFFLYGLNVYSNGSVFGLSLLRSLLFVCPVLSSLTLICRIHFYAVVMRWLMFAPLLVCEHAKALSFLLSLTLAHSHFTFHANRLSHTTHSHTYTFLAFLSSFLSRCCFSSRTSVSERASECECIFLAMRASVCVRCIDRN